MTDYTGPRVTTFIGVILFVMFLIPSVVLWHKTGDIGFRSLLGEVGIGDGEATDTFGLLLLLALTSSITAAGFMVSAVGIIWWVAAAARAPKTKRRLRESGELAGNLSRSAAERAREAGKSAADKARDVRDRNR